MQDILAPDSIKERLIKALKSDRQSHAVLYKGGLGCAALPLAIAIIKYLHCETQSACGTCHACYLSQRYIHPDTHFFFPQARTDQVEEGRTAHLQAFRSFLSTQPYGMPNEWHNFLLTQKNIKEAANKQLSISRASVKNLLNIVTHTAYQSPHKAIVVWVAEYMHEGAVNALLKNLRSSSCWDLFLFYQL